MKTINLAHFYEDIAGIGAGFEDTPEIGPHTRSRVGDTPLHIAAVRGEVQTVGWLLEAGADINTGGEIGYTALHYAVEHGHPEVVRLLLQRGANREIRFFESHAGETALELTQHLDDGEAKQKIIALLQGRAP